MRGLVRGYCPAVAQHHLRTLEVASISLHKDVTDFEIHNVITRKAIFVTKVRQSSSNDEPSNAHSILMTHGHSDPVWLRVLYTSPHRAPAMIAHFMCPDYTLSCS
jgi:hypothetical protein